MVLCGPTTKDESGLKMAQRLCSRVADRATLALTEPAYESAPASGRVRVPTAIIHTLIRVNLFYPGVLTPSLSISTAFSNLFNRVSCFLASVIQRQYSLRCV